jgi:hypothetical protein
MERRNFVLAALSVANGATYTPVQVQKLFVLIDREIPKLVNGPHFTFEPYNYGPFDQEVYRELELLEMGGYVELVPQSTWSAYRLTDQGQESGEEYLNQIDKKAIAYIRQASEFVRSLSFTQLVSAIYKAYPEMRENSVFQH